MYKICTKCKQEKLLSDFHKSSKEKDGLKHKCKICRSQEAEVYNKKLMQNEEKREKKNNRLRKWRKKKVLEDPNYYSDQYYKDHEGGKRRSNEYYHRNKEVCNSRAKSWRENNREVSLEASQKWKREHKEQYLESHRQWIKNNKEHVRAYNQMRRALKYNATIQVFTDLELEQRMSVFGFCCAYCNGPFEHIDHVIPLSKGGKHCLANLRPACAKCNLSKHNKNLYEWLNLKKVA